MACKAVMDEAYICLDGLRVTLIAIPSPGSYTHNLEKTTTCSTLWCNYE